MGQVWKCWFLENILIAFCSETGPDLQKRRMRREFVIFLLYMRLLSGRLVIRILPSLVLAKKYSKFERKLDS